MIGFGGLASGDRLEDGLFVLGSFSDGLCHACFGFADAPAFLTDALDEGQLFALATEAQKGFCVPCADLFALDRVGDDFREFEQSHHVRDGAAVDFESFGEIFLGAAMFCQVAFERHRFFDGVEILALEVFDDRKFGHETIVGLAEFGADGFETGADRSAKAAFAADELVAVPGASNQDGLELLVFLDALG